MISLSEAFDIVISTAATLGTEELPFTAATGRITAQDIRSDIDMPPFDKAAMDGFACKKEDIGSLLEIVETIPAGKFPEKTIMSGQCARIMTGAPLPHGADCVLMVEFTEQTDERHIRFTRHKTDENICYLGEDIRKGDIVIPKGTLIRNSHIAAMAATGCVMPLCYKQPKIAILSTGDEIVEPHFIPGKGQIRNSNGYQLLAQAHSCHALAEYLGIIPDNENATLRLLESSLAHHNILLLSGGVSMGDFDHIPQVMQQAGIDIRFRKIAVQPGKPTTFGIKNGKWVFGLPGNPVSAFIQFELLVKPLIYKIMGHNYKAPNLLLPMGTEYTRKKTERESFFPVKITSEGTVIPATYHGSAHIFALCGADGIISIAPGKSIIHKGELVHVRQI